MTTPSLFDLPPDTVKPPRFEPTKAKRRSRQSADADFFAAYFRERPDAWISALELMNLRACLSFRTRLSDLRYAPYEMDIRNRQEVVQGTRYSFYKFVPSGSQP